MNSSDEKPVKPRLQREPNGQLTFLPGGDQPAISDCRVARCFPWSLPDQFISVRDNDGNEVHLFASLEGVVAASRRLLLAELAAQEFIPRIQRVHDIDDTFDILIWKVDTDRGRMEFQVRYDEDVRPLGENRVVIKDHKGMLFEIPNLEALDETSRALVEDRLG